MRRPIAAAITLAAALGAACLAIPPFRPRVLLSYTLDDPTRDDSGATITGSGFTLHFAGGSSFHFPDQLMIGSSGNLLGHDSASRCYDQSGTGLSLYPTPRVSADSIATPAQNQLVPVLSGPAVVQVRLDWAARFDCNAHRAPGGNSTFTVFPDGRIVRHDKLGDTSREPIQASQCACGSDSLNEFIIASYWMFARSFPTLYVPGTDSAQELSFPAAGEAHLYSTICLDGGPYQLASFEVVVPPADPAADPDTTEVFGGTDVIGHRIEQPLGRSSLEVLSWDVHSALFIERGGCPAAFQRAADHAAPRMLTINGNPTPPSPLDGMYGGDMGNGQTGIDLPDGHARVTGPTTGPFAVWLRFPSTVVVPVASRAGAAPSFYVPQRVDDRNWILWFKDPLAKGETITVDPD